MNKLILILTFLPFSSLIAQEEYPIFSSNNNWWIKAYTIDGSYEQTWFYDIKITGDTLIDGQEYKIMEDNFLWDYVAYYHNSPNFLGYDENKKTFLRINDSVEILLYDFNLEVGDTFQVISNFNFDTFSEIIVQEIDSVEFDDGSLRKRYNFGPLPTAEMDFIFQNCGSANEFTWIEGIGASFHPLYAIWDCFEAGPDLDCYSFNEEEVYGNCLYNPIIDAGSGKIEAYPNPFTNEITILDPDSQIESAALFTINGVKVSQLSLMNRFSGLEFLPNGVYILKMELRDKSRLIYKLIK